MMCMLPPHPQGHDVIVSSAWAVLCSAEDDPAHIAAACNALIRHAKDARQDAATRILSDLQVKGVA